jgi:hypothetical protein
MRSRWGSQEPAWRTVWHDLAKAHMLGEVMQLADLCVGKVPAWPCHHISGSRTVAQELIIL